MNKTVSIIITIGLIVAIAIVFMGGLKPKNTSQIAQNTEIKDGIQYITIYARGGYLPEISNAKADIPTKLIIKTNGTYDCSASLVIKSINYQKFLSQTGEEIIDIGTPKYGEPLIGVCSMGMYSFEIYFS